MSKKCQACGCVNFRSRIGCKRCGRSLADAGGAGVVWADEAPPDVVGETTPDGLKLTYRWTVMNEAYGVVFVLFLDVVFVIIATNDRNGLDGPFQWAVGIVLALAANYYFFAMAVNSTTVEVTASRLLARHWPVPWPGNRSIARADVSGFEYRRTRRSRRWVYTIAATLSTGGSRTLIVCGSESVVFVGRRLEEHLGLPPGRKPD